jgi:excisionase family DNA binding protein
MEDRQLSLSEVAGLMGVSERTVRRWIKAGKLRAYKPGRDYRIPEGGLRQFIAESEISPKGESRSSLEPSFNDVLADERREDIEEVALEAARQQLKQDSQAAVRALESEQPQTYFKHHDNAVAIRLRQYPQDELASALMDLARRYVELELEKERENAALIKQLEEVAGRA